MEVNNVFDFEWLNCIEDIYINATTKEPEMIIEYLPYPVRLSTGPYGGYIVTIKDLDSNETISFNCGKMDLEPEHLEQTYFEMRKRFALTKGDGVYFARKNIKVLSVTIPKNHYKELLKRFNINNSLLWRIWELGEKNERLKRKRR
jgi:hypothetical protein